MTIERRQTIDPADLETIEIRCRGEMCRTRIIYAIDRDPTQRLSCPDCGADFALPSTANLATAVKELKSVLRAIASPSNAFRARLGLRGDLDSKEQT